MIDAFVPTLALVGVVILVAALLSGLVERSRLPEVGVFLGLGAVLGPFGLSVLNVSLDSPALRIVATLSLVLVIFTDAVTIDFVELRRRAGLSLIAVGPGTLLTAALVGLAGWGILGLAPAPAAILGAALASTDPVLLRGVLRGRELPAVARQVLRVEGGVNDAVLLPVVLVAMAFVMAESGATQDWGSLAISLLLLGPGAGVAVGLVSVAALDLMRRRMGVKRDYESLYALGTAFAAFAAAEAVHGSGFLAVFAAGFTIAALDVELCDCFLEYGQTTAELALLFSFVLLGGALIWSGLGVISMGTILFTVVTLLIRPATYLAFLSRAPVDRRSRLLIAWLGPRGLSSILIVLLPVFAGLPGSDQLFAICCLVVLVSMVLHGGTPLVLSWNGRRGQAARGPLPAASAESLPSALLESPTPAGGGGALSLADAGDDPDRDAPDPLRLSIDELRRIWSAGEPVMILDARTDRSYNQSGLQPTGAIRLPPDDVPARLPEIGAPRAAWVVALCA